MGRGGGFKKTETCFSYSFQKTNARRHRQSLARQERPGNPPHGLFNAEKNLLHHHHHHYNNVAAVDYLPNHVHIALIKPLLSTHSLAHTPAPFFASAIFTPMKAQIHSGRGERYRCARCTVVHRSPFLFFPRLRLFSCGSWGGWGCCGHSHSFFSRGSFCLGGCFGYWDASFSSHRTLG